MSWNFLFLIISISLFTFALLSFFRGAKRWNVWILVCLFCCILLYSKKTQIRRDAIRIWRSKNKQTLYSCACTKKTMKLPKDSYRKHRYAAKRLSRSIFLSDDEVLQGAIERGTVKGIPKSPGYRVQKMNYGTANLHIHALKRLKELDDAFQKALRSVQLPKAEFVITSAARTKVQQQALRSVADSAHSYGASFDVDRIRTVGPCRKTRKIFRSVLEKMRKEKKLYLCPEKDHLHLTVR